MDNPLLESLKEYYNTTSREQIEKDWAKVAKYDKVGPTINEFLNSQNETSMKVLGPDSYVTPDQREAEARVRLVIFFDESFKKEKFSFKASEIPESEDIQQALFKEYDGVGWDIKRGWNGSRENGYSYYTFSKKKPS